MVAMVAWEAADYELVLTEAERAIALDPDHWSAYALRVQALRLSRSEASLEEGCALLAAVQPAEPWVFMQRGLYLGAWCGRPDLAELDYAEAIERAPAWSTPLLARAEHYFRENRNEEALADLNRAIGLSPRWGDAYLTRGQVLADLGRYEDALAAFDKAEAFGVWGRTASGLHASRASALARLGLVEEAIAAVDAGVEERPGSADAHAARAEILFRLGRFGDAVAGMREAVELEPGATHRLSRLLKLMSFHTPACSEVAEGVEQLRESRPSGVPMWNEIAWLHVAFLVYGCPDVYDEKIALEQARAAVATDPTDGSWQDTLGLALYRNGLYEEAETALRVAADAGHDDNPHTLFSLAMTCWKLGKKTEARRYYDRAVARMQANDPDDPVYQRRRAEAAQVLGVE
jgi:tetratricopeptide (TPR) repeat protein